FPTRRSSDLFRETFAAAPIVLLDDQAGEVPAEGLELRNVGVSGFEYRFSVADPQAPGAALVRIAYLAASAGEYTHGGLAWKAGTEPVQTADPSIGFATAFGGAPVALLRADGAEAGLSASEAAGLGLALDFGGATPPATVDVAYVAVEAGSGSASGPPIEAARSAHAAEDAATAFAAPCPQPVVFAATQTNAAAVPLHCEAVPADALGFASASRGPDGPRGQPPAGRRGRDGRRPRPRPGAGRRPRPRRAAGDRGARRGARHLPTPGLLRPLPRPGPDRFPAPPRRRRPPVAFGPFGGAGA